MDKTEKVIYEQNGNITKEIEDMKRHQKEILQLKRTVIEMKELLELFKSRFEV